MAEITIDHHLRCCFCDTCGKVRDLSRTWNPETFTILADHFVKKHRCHEQYISPTNDTPATDRWRQLFAAIKI